ncbi:Hypothetical protein A7982_08272 [Minicystis rosea]|nr:Hypothetical protein A7982_08272 [Minicystis rosea]
MTLAAGVGCGGGTPEPNTEAAATATATPTAEAPPPPPAKPAPEKNPKDDPLSDDQKAQMEVALRRGGAKAANCISVAADAKAGEGEVTVVFDGKIGKATDVVVGPPWAGTPLVESCIKRAFIGEYVVPFEGKLEVPYTVKLGKGDAPDPKKDGKKAPKKK